LNFSGRRAPRWVAVVGTMSDEESSDEDYDYHATTNEIHGEDCEARYPVHDCCEFDDVDALKVKTSNEIDCCCTPASVRLTFFALELRCNLRCT
jgi:hypothetical protein